MRGGLRELNNNDGVLSEEEGLEEKK